MFNFGPKIPQISVDEVKKSLDEKEKVVILDVRTPEEFSRNRIQGSINVPVDEVTENIEKIISDKKQRIYLYCMSGARSGHATRVMLKMGYKNIYNVASGLLAWRAKHYPLES